MFKGENAMNKEILISIKPEHAFNILNGDQTLLIRKSAPKDYVGWVNIYVTKVTPLIWLYKGNYFNSETTYVWGHNRKIKALNGKVVARFWLDEIAIFNYIDIAIPNGYEDFDGEWVDTTNHEMCYWIKRQELNAACVECENDLEEYGKGKTLYAWHIRRLDIFDNLVELSYFGITKALKNWQYLGRKV